MPFLDILYPSGHKAKIEIAQNVPLIKALEDACAKRGLDPMKHTLTHNRHPLDLSVAFRLSGLVNHAALQLVEIPTDSIANIASTEVRVCVRLENGQREEWIGDAHMPIWSLLETLATTNSNIASFLSTDPQSETIPVVVYLQDQLIPGEACLRGTTLAKLGIRSGSALLNLHRRTVTSDQLQKAEAKLLQPTVTVPRLTADSRASTSQTPANRTSLQDARPATSSSRPISSDLVERAAHFPTQSIDRRQEAKQISPQPGQESTGFISPWSVFAERPQTSAFASVGSTGSIPTASAFTQQDRRGQTLGEILGISLDSSDPVETAETSNAFPKPDQSFSTFKFPAETEGMNLLGAQLKSDASAVSSCDREMVAYTRRVKNESKASDVDDLPDDFFEHTEEDIRRLLMSYRKEWSSEAPLQTQAMRKAARERLYAKYPRALIQFHWPDNIVVQACFKPQEPVSALYAFVGECLRDSQLDFHLYTTPPKIVLREKQLSLIQANLVPMVKVYVSTDAGGSCKAKDVLRNDLLESATNVAMLDAQKVVARWMTKGVSVHRYDACSASASTSATVTAGPSHPMVAQQGLHNTTTQDLPESAPMPKWFKLGK